MIVTGRGEGATALDRMVALALAAAGEAAPGTTLVDAGVAMVGRTAAGVLADGFPPVPTVVHAPPAAGAAAVVG